MYKQFLETLETREKEIEENLTMVTHELSTPISNIKILITELGKKYKQENTLTEGFSKIKKIIDLCLFNINFRKENHRIYKSNNNHTIFEIKQLIKNCVEIYKKTHNDPIDIEISGESFMLQSDFTFFWSIFSNLLSNSFHFIKKSGKGCIYISTSVTEKYHIIIFKDTGSGIKPDIAPLIFEKGLSRRRDGTGMGLYMCRDLIEHLGGNISCESVLGECPKFVILFPRPSV